MKGVRGFLKEELVDEFIEGCIALSMFNEDPDEIEADLYKKSVSKWDCGLRIDWAIEEMSELIQALCKSKRDIRPENWLENIYEEIVDVEIMLGTLKMMYGDPDTIGTTRHQKLERLKKRLGMKPIWKDVE